MSIPLGQPDGLTEVRRVFFADDISNMFPGSAEITLKDILKKIPFQNINYPHVINYTVSQDYTRFIFPEYCEDPPVYTETDYVDNTYQLGEMQFVMVNVFRNVWYPLLLSLMGINCYSITTHFMNICLL